MQTGEEFPVFIDRRDIQWGENWARRIDESLDASTLFIPIISPSYFASDVCLAELDRFLQHERQLDRSDLVLPVYYVESRLLTQHEALTTAARLARILASRQYRDWRHLRFETSKPFFMAIAELASDIRRTLERVRSAVADTDSGERVRRHRVTKHETNAFRVIHIADLHFGRGHQVLSPAELGNRYAEELEDQWRRHDLISSPLDALVLSGDFSFECRPEGFEAAATFVKRLSDLVRPHSILVVPGAHDIGRGASLTIGQYSLPIGKLDAERPFREFVRSLGNHVVNTPNTYLSAALRLARGDGRGVVILGLNTCRVERVNLNGCGYVGADQIYDVGQSCVRGPVQSGDLLIAVTHHNLVPIADVDFGLSGPIPIPITGFPVDAGSVLAFLADLGVVVTLHGHARVSLATSVGGYGSLATDPQDRPIISLGTGNFGVMNTTVPGHCCRLLEITIPDHGEASLKWRDFSSSGGSPTAARRWVSKVSRPVVLNRFWDPRRAQETIRSTEWAALLARIDWEFVESWSILRAKSQLPKDWPRVQEDLYKRVKDLAPNVTFQDVQDATEQIFQSPPSGDIVEGLTLQEYIAARWIKPRG